MASVIYYKLKNAIQQHHVNFDGSVIQIGDVKRLVAAKQGLGPEGALELTLFDPNTGDEYADDGKVIPRNTMVLVKRAPATKFKPLVAGDGGAAPSAPAGPAAAPASTAPAVPEGGAGGDFGGDFYSDQPTAAVVGEDETKALQSFLQGTAATWQREVRQGTMRGRGRGRGRGGGVAPDYKCPRCDAIGVHWLQDCPTQGDPAYDRKRVRPPVGIPMTRLARSQEGGLVLPDGQTGTLVANEDAFAREILGLGLLPQGGAAGDGMGNGDDFGAAATGIGEDAQPALLALDNKPANEVVAPAVLPTGPPVITAPPPVLAGEEEMKGPGAAPMPGASIFDIYMRAALLPRGPPVFLEKAYGGNTPLGRSEFEKMQDSYRQRYKLPPLRRRSRSRSPGHRSRRSSRRSRSRSRTRDRSRSSSRDRDRSKRSKKDRRDRSADRGSKRDRDRDRERKSSDHKSRHRDKDKDRDRSRRRDDEGSRRRSDKDRGEDDKDRKKDKARSVSVVSEEKSARPASTREEEREDEPMDSTERAAGTQSDHVPEHGHEPELDYGSSDPEHQGPPATTTNGGGRNSVGGDDEGGRKRQRIEWPGTLDAKKSDKGISKTQKDSHRGGDGKRPSKWDKDEGPSRDERGGGRGRGGDGYRESSKDRHHKGDKSSERYGREGRWGY